MGIRIKHRNPKTTEFTQNDLVINIKTGRIFYKSHLGIHSLFGGTTTNITTSTGTGTGTSVNLQNANDQEILFNNNGNIDGDSKLKYIFDTDLSGNLIDQALLVDDIPATFRGILEAESQLLLTGGVSATLPTTGVELATNVGLLSIANGGGEILIGGQTSRATFSTDLDEFYFGKKIVVDQGIVSSNDEDLKLRCANNTNNTNIILKKSTVDPVVSINGDLRVNAHGNNFGKVLAANDIIAFASDKRLKENIIEISNPLDKIQQVRGVYFDWNQKSKEKGFKAAREKNEIGMIAQEVEQIIPQAIEPAPFNKEYKTIKYDRLIPLLVECIKDQQKQIDELKSKIN